MMQPPSASVHPGMSSAFGRDGQHPHPPGNSFAYGMPPSSFAPNHAGQPGMVALNNAFAGITVQDGMTYRGPEMAVPALTMANPQLNIVPNNLGLPHQALFLMHPSGVVYAPTNVAPLAGLPATGAMPAGAPALAMADRPHPRGAPYERQPGVAHQEYGPVPFTPSPRNFAPMQESGAGEPPGLETRQVSLGSHSDSEQVSSPDTPDGLDTNRLGQNVIIARTDLSPIVQYGYGAHSPQQFLPAYEHAQAAKPLALRSLAGNIVAVANAATIPRAVPAVTTCRKTLQTCLENPTGTTNVYIRGLHPGTTDDMLLAYACRFGHVANSKAMIDNQTGACKGFGFACFRSMDEAQNCIRGFYALGYEVSFARESFNVRLKSYADPSSTNLYVSNLPRSMTETELAAVFHEYKVQSSRIIRDAQGHSKGVGFARFGSREECDEIIQKYHGKPVGQEQLLLQVRYADTPEQKRLKHETQKRREFRANEYNAVAYATPAAYFPFRPARGGLVGPPLSAPCARHVDMQWVGISTPPNSVGMINKAETPTHNTSQAAENKSHSEAESKAAQSADAGDSAPVNTNTPTIAYGDTYSRPAVAASA